MDEILSGEVGVLRIVDLPGVLQKLDADGSILFGLFAGRGWELLQDSSIMGKKSTIRDGRSVQAESDSATLRAESDSAWTERMTQYGPVQDYL